MRAKDRKVRVKNAIVKRVVSGVLSAQDEIWDRKGELRVDNEKYRVECHQGRCRLVRRDDEVAGIADRFRPRRIMRSPKGVGPAYEPERIFGGGVLIKK